MNITDIEASYDRLAVFYNILNSIFFMGTDKMFRTELVRYLRLKSDKTGLFNTRNAASRSVVYGPGFQITPNFGLNCSRSRPG